jgi:hypothetical protein
MSLVDFCWKKLSGKVVSLVLYSVVISVIPATLHAQPKPSGNYAIPIRRATDKVVIDGKLTEGTWQNTETSERFFQNFPYDSSFAVQQTDIKLTYDDDALYIAAICYDTLKLGYFIQSLRRDFSFFDNDNLAIYIDALNTKTTGFVFSVTPLGVLKEGTIEGGGNFGTSNIWDNKWFAETHIDSTFWTAEIAIPFNTLRFKSGVGEWRINFARRSVKNNEVSTWFPIPRNFRTSSLAFTGRILWDTPPQNKNLNLAVIPYTSSNTAKNYQTGTAALSTVNGGTDAKFAVSSSLNLDLTVNPDFSQVDVDRQITNLDRFSIFFPEQRQFFLENSDVLASFGFSRIRPFFSRRIGLFNGQQVPILFGARLSGNINKDWRIGILNMQTRETPVIGNNDSTFLLPTQNYAVAAAQRQVFDRSNIAAIFVNRQGKDFNQIAGNDFNRTAGVDYNLASADGKWVGRLFYHQNFTPVPLAQQYASAMFLRYDAPTFALEWNHEVIGANYNPELGFVPRTNVVRFEPNATYRFFPSSPRMASLLNNHGISAGMNMFRRFDDFSILDNEYNFTYFFNFKNTSALEFNAGTNFIRLTSPFDATGRGDAANALPVGDYPTWYTGIEYASDFRKPFFGRAEFYHQTYFTGNLNFLLLEGNYRFQPYGTFSLRFQQNDIRLPSPFESAVLRLISARMELSFTRGLFFTTFVQYNTQIQNVNLNARLQWRFAPMSDVFLVLTDNYFSENFAVRNRGFVLKVSYWFNT